jgi:cytochrome P450
VAFYLLWRVAIYFRDRHGLRKFHNMSLFSGLTNLPFMMVAHKPFRSEYLRKKHENHSVLRIGPEHLSFSDPRVIKDIYGHGSKACKDDFYSITAASSGHMHLADVSDKSEHARKRKVLSAAYALKNLEDWEYKVADKVERMFKQLDQRCTDPLPAGQLAPAPQDLTINYREWTNFFTVDAIADIGLSEKLGFLDRGEDTCVARNLDGSTYKAPFRHSLYMNARKQSLLSHSYSWYKMLDKATSWIPGAYRTGSRAARDWDAIVLERSQSRLDAYMRGEKFQDFFQVLMEDKCGKANNLEWGEINAEVNIMMNAGSTTTAIALANVLFHLLKHPDVLERLRIEVDTVLESDEVIAPYDKVKNLPYLRACLDESLRIFAPTAHNLGRKTPPEGLWVGDDFIPGGISVSMSAHVIHRNESIFQNADQYVPERWLGENGKALQPYFLAFSAGSRGCIGRNISYLEQTVLLASVIHRYEFALPSPEWEVERLEAMNLLVGDIPLKIWRRDIPGS